MATRLKHLRKEIDLSKQKKVDECIDRHGTCTGTTTAVSTFLSTAEGLDQSTRKKEEERAQCSFRVF